MFSLDNRIKEIKGILTSEDVLVFQFISEGGKRFAAIYADGVADKPNLGELVVKPLRAVKKDDGIQTVKLLLASPEVKDGEDINSALEEISDGNVALFIDGEERFFIIGLKSPPGRTVTEPPTQIAVKGPREGFTEDIKTNMGLVRKRIKTADLQIKTLKVGKQSQTTVAVIYIDGVCKQGLPEKIEKQILSKEIDVIPDSSYVSRFLTRKPRSLFKRCATSEKPDIFCSKVSEGRVGIIVDGSPIALTVPYMVIEDFQSGEDYYIEPHRATIIRLVRILSLMVGILLPAFYISAQLFKIQLIPVKLLFKISSSVSGIPFSPSIEMFFTLFVLEVLNEASIRMPKYVGLALSVVGALVLGDTAVKAGIISTPAIIIVAFSAICLYTVPDLIDTTATLRWLYLIVAGSVGTFGIILTTAVLICYMLSEQSYGVPLLAPFAPLVKTDLKDTAIKSGIYSLDKRPKAIKSNNVTRLKEKE